MGMMNGVRPKKSNPNIISFCLKSEIISQLQMCSFSIWDSLFIIEMNNYSRIRGCSQAMEPRPESNDSLDFLLVTIIENWLWRRSFLAAGLEAAAVSTSGSLTVTSMLTFEAMAANLQT
jgi:hypothetical protein